MTLKTTTRRGVALILVLGALAVLALLATAFATLSGVERRFFWARPPCRGGAQGLYKK